MTDGNPVIGAAFTGTLGAFSLDIAFDVPTHGVTALFGPSGCGKTTVLRCVAGLHRLAGSLTVDGETWQDDSTRTFRKPHERPVGYVFQEASLFAHLSVRRNLLYGARRAARKGGPASLGFDDVVDLLGIGHLLDRAPLALSGGERQRVAVGRALLSQPRLLLMDEPLAALDRLTKEEILPYLDALHENLSIPVLYVSHDMTEVERLADHLVLMKAGRVLAAGRLSDLQADPSLPLASARDAAVSLDAVVEAYDARYGLLTLGVDGGRFLVTGAPDRIGARRRLRVVAGDVSLAREPLRSSTILNVLPARIVTGSPLGEHEMIVVLRLQTNGTGARLLARITRRSWEHLGLAEGDAVYAQIKGVALAPATGA